MQGFMAALQALDSPQLRRITDEAMTGDGLLVERERRVFFHWNPQLKIKVAMVSQTIGQGDDACQRGQSSLVHHHHQGLSPNLIQ